MKPRSKFFATALSLVLLLSACSPAPQTVDDATIAIASRKPQSVGQIAVGTGGAVASVDGFATQVGIDVLRDGGNAMDAAIAVGFALAVTHPSAGNIGGGGFMTIYVADEDRYTPFDFRERAPLAATADLYLLEDGTVDRRGGHAGWTAIGVPGTVAGFAKVHEELGSLPWRRLVQPAVQLARDGIVLGPYLSRSLAGAARAFAPYPASQKAFLRADGTPHEVGWSSPIWYGRSNRSPRTGPRLFMRARSPSAWPPRWPRTAA